MNGVAILRFSLLQSRTPTMLWESGHILKLCKVVLHTFIYFSVSVVPNDVAYDGMAHTIYNIVEVRGPSGH